MNINISVGDTNIVFASPFVPTQAGQIIVAINKILPGSVSDTRIVEFTATISYDQSLSVTREDEFLIDTFSSDSVEEQVNTYLISLFCQ